MATTRAQQAFRAFLDAQNDPSYDYDAMTPEQKLAENDRYTSLKIAAHKEIAANNAGSQAAAEKAAAERTEALRARMQAAGYSGEGSLADFEALFRRDQARYAAGEPNYFGGRFADGETPETLAAAHYGDGTRSFARFAHLMSMYHEAS